VITDWNVAFLNAIRIETTAPTLASRNLAMLQLAVYDAVNSIDGGYQPYLARLDPPLTAASMEAAASAAAHNVSVTLYPSLRATFDSLFVSTLTAIPDGPAKQAGLALGLSAAQAMLAARAADGASTSVPYIPGTDPGDWRRTPPFFRPPESPQWPFVTPFAMTSGSQFRPPGPPALDSARYAADFNQVKELGALDSPTRTTEQTSSARFWSDFSYTATPPGHWNEIATSIASERGTTLVENARLLALINLALADAAIVSWDAKYEFNLWRPITAIQQADLDGNPGTIADAHWSPLLNTPPFPEYTSGHSTFSGAAAAVLRAFYGTDELHFIARSDTVPGATREFQNLTQAVDEIGMSRIYGGIHFLSADLDGIDAGTQLGIYVANNFLLPIPEPSTWALLALGLGVLWWRWEARRLTSGTARRPERAGFFP
jgi:hypothetical protein